MVNSKTQFSHLRAFLGGGMDGANLQTLFVSGIELEVELSPIFLWGWYLQSVKIP